MEGRKAEDQTQQEEEEVVHQLAEGRAVRLRVASRFEGSHFSVEDQGCFLWPAARPLCDYLLTHGEELIHGRRCLELGAGAGLCACVVAKFLRPLRFVTTDNSEKALYFLKTNLEIAGKEEPTDRSCSAECMPFDWADPSPLSTLNAEDGFDLVFGSDLVWDSAGANLLFAVVKRALRPTKEALFLLSFVPRSEFLRSYVREAATAEGFFLESVVVVPLGGGEDQKRKTGSYSQMEVEILRFKLLSQSYD
ncbi:FAM86 domain-containing protein [Balamuthia mandrillaris]